MPIRSVLAILALLSPSCAAPRAAVVTGTVSGVLGAVAMATIHVRDCSSPNAPELCGFGQVQDRSEQSIATVIMLGGVGLIFAGIVGLANEHTRHPASPGLIAPAATTTAPAAGSPDAAEGRAPGAVSASGEQTEWWCSVSGNQAYGFCMDRVQKCEALRKDLLEERGFALPLSPCAMLTTVACFHHVAIFGRDRSCFPTLELCNNRRDLMRDHMQKPPTDECTMFGTASAAPAQH